MSRGDFHGAGLLKQVAATGRWPHHLKFECGIVDSPACTLCGHLSHDEFHTCRECPRVLEHPAMQALDDAALVTIAQRQGRSRVYLLDALSCP